MTDDEGTPDQPNPNGPDKRPDDLSADELAAAFHRRSDSGAADWMRPREGRRANATLLAHADKQVPADPDGPLYGPLAQGLALGALRALSTPDLWNTLSAIGSDGAARRGLLTAWGIENTDDWFTTMTSLIGLTEFIETESMLDARAVSIAFSAAVASEARVSISRDTVGSDATDP